MKKNIDKNNYSTNIDMNYFGETETIFKETNVTNINSNNLITETKTFNKTTNWILKISK